MDYHAEVVTFFRRAWKALWKWHLHWGFHASRNHATLLQCCSTGFKKIILFPNKLRLFWAASWTLAIAFWFSHFLYNRECWKYFPCKWTSLRNHKCWDFRLSHKSLKVLQKQAVMLNRHIQSPADFSESIQYAVVTVCTGHHEIVHFIAVCMQH